MKTFAKIKNAVMVGAVVAVSCVTLTACSGSGEGSEALSKYEKADLSGYEGMKDYNKEIMLVDMTVDDIKKEVDKNGTFAFVASYSTCPYCNVIMPFLNDYAIQENTKVGYLDTRKNPEWKNNMEIDGYDTFLVMFGNYLRLDENEKRHLYVPHMFFIKNGKVVYNFQGVSELLENEDSTVTDEIAEDIKLKIKEGFDELK